jgi:hypothetical protein
MFARTYLSGLSYCRIAELMRWIWILILASTATAQTTIGGSSSLGGSVSMACGLPNFCSPTNTNNDQISAPATLIGVTGAHNSFVDVTGNTVVRCTNYNDSGLTAGTASFRSNSDSNDNVWSSDDTIIGICRTGAALMLAAWDPIGQTCTPKGVTGSSTAQCDAASWLHSTPNAYYSINGANQLNLYTVDKTNAAWTASTGGNQNLSAAISSVTKLDISTQCSGLTYNKYQFLVNVYGLDHADRFTSFDARVAQDYAYQHFVFDSVNGCWWWDSRTMTAGGAWGPTSIINASTVLLPTPPAPTVTPTTGGSLALGTYDVCITYVKSEIGETPCSSNTVATLTGGNNAFTVTPPTANPSGTVSKATGFQVYACTPDPCTPKQQTNGTNASGILTQPTITSIVCATNCSGAVTYSFRVAANNAGGSSPLSAATVTAAVGVNATFTATIPQVTNASTYTWFLDFTYIVDLNANAGTCSAGNCTFTLSTNSNSVPFIVAQNQTVPIATTPTVTSLLTTTDTAPGVNSTGWRTHDDKNDGVKWYTTIPFSGSSLQSAYTGNPRIFIDWSNGTALFASGTSTPSLNMGNMVLGHMAVGFGEFFGFDGNAPLFWVRYTLNDTSTTAEGSKVTLVNQTHTTDVHHSAQWKSINPTYPFYTATDRSSGSHALPADGFDTFQFGVPDTANANFRYKFCENWSSGMQGFNSQVSGNPSPDGKFILFSSDMGIGTGVTSGQLGDSSGNATCTDNTNCRTDAYVCITR